jgi:hypothetical protein
MESRKVGNISNIDIVRRSPLFIPTMIYLLGILIGSRYYADIKILLRALFLSTPIAFFIINRFYNRRGIHTDILLPVMLGISLLLAGWLNVNTSGFLKMRSEHSKIAGIESLEANCKITGEIAEKKRSIQTEVTLIEYNEKNVALYR